MSTKDTINAITRVFLRALPLVPGPEIYDLILTIRRTQNDLDRDVAEAVQALQKSSNTVATLESKLKERSDRLIALQNEYKRLSDLTNITTDQAQAITKQLEMAVGKNRNTERVVALAINLVAGIIVFVFGVIFSDKVSAFFGVATH
jgi:hypothetical protein